jgi:tRNA threonylcarbamoyladenosine biosynthesis protein TsaE
VRSPTYTLVELYRIPSLTVLHCDLYRLRTPAELEDLGLREWAAPGYLWLVEWPERGAGLLPRADLTATLAALPGAHSLELASATPRGAAWLGRLHTG